MHAASNHYSVPPLMPLITGETKVNTITVTIAKGQQLPANAVLGRNDKGEYVLSDAAATDGSQVPDCILAYAVDAKSQAQSAGVCAAGCFNPAALYLGNGHTEQTLMQPFRERGIFLKTPSYK
ncbi:head decoration protein [Zooshikella sp. RANM57]|uniref:head decoration protein n=1 Tax=Zooshikella sp. RANM57 TaxID=3425863 RepID=UPI003D6EFD74